METRVEEALKRESRGFNCAQAVACTYCDLVGLVPEIWRNRTAKLLHTNCPEKLPDSSRNRMVLSHVRKSKVWEPEKRFACAETVSKTRPNWWSKSFF